MGYACGGCCASLMLVMNCCRRHYNAYSCDTASSYSAATMTATANRYPTETRQAYLHFETEPNALVVFSQLPKAVRLQGLGRQPSLYVSLLAQSHLDGSPQGGGYGIRLGTG